MANPSSADSSCWWQSLNDDCPITLEPLSTLPYPPFYLISKEKSLVDDENEGSRGAIGKRTTKGDAKICESAGERPQVKYYFDGLALASYAVSRGIFQNPLTREALTWDDCRRLDEYLGEHCNGSPDANAENKRPSSGSNGPVSASGADMGERQNRICVCEAFALRESVKVRSDVGRDASDNGSGERPHSSRLTEWELRRAEALRSEAASALRGLFVFGNGGRRCVMGGRADLRVAWSDVRDRRRTEDRNSVPTAGFDLNRSRRIGDGGGGIYEVEGLRIIDDDVAVSSASDYSAWEEVQRAFPKLGSDELSEDDRLAEASSSVDDDEASSSLLLEKAKKVANRTRAEEERKQKFIDDFRRQELVDAMRRREELLREKEKMRERQKTLMEEKKAEREDIAQARAEIDRWREEQWERLARWTEQEFAKQQKQPKFEMGSDHFPGVASSNPRNEPSETREEIDARKKGEEDKERAAAKAAKAAAKRRRQKEKKKAKKMLEQEAAKKEAKLAEAKKKKEASAIKCGACGEGVIGRGFEKFGIKFCSTKCARAGPSC